MIMMLQFVFLFFVGSVYAILNATEDATQLVISNDRLYASVNKSSGAIDVLTLDGQNLLGSKEYNAATAGGNAAGQNGIGPYLDCDCTPDGSYTPGSIDPYFKLFKGNDSSGVSYGGIVMGEVSTSVGRDEHC